MKPLTKAVIGLSAAGAAYVGVQKIRQRLSDEPHSHVEVHGFVSRGYEAVRDAFTENFTRRGEVGAACCVYHKNRKIVALAGDQRDVAIREALYSATPATSMTC